MKSIQFPQYSQEQEGDIGALCEYLFEKHSDIFDVFYLEECADDDIDKSCINCALVDESENEANQNFNKLCLQINYPVTTKENSGQQRGFLSIVPVYRTNKRK